MDFFGIGPLELLVIVIVGLLVMGPDHLPRLANRLGSMLQQARKSVAEARDGMLVDLEAEQRKGAAESGGADQPRPTNGRASS